MVLILHQTSLSFSSMTCVFLEASQGARTHMKSTRLLSPSVESGSGVVEAGGDGRRGCGEREVPPQGGEACGGKSGGGC